MDFSLVTVTLLRVTVPLPKSKLSPTRRMFLSVMYSVSVWSVFGSELSDIVSSICGLGSFCFWSHQRKGDDRQHAERGDAQSLAARLLL